mmetsp:Transcript_20096/g.28884  ORF Transcript_20096/g.28884 Transcript_20096/m.28884 type:complete len:355 (+) Transcript_20096:110-1174(+)
MILEGVKIGTVLLAVVFWIYSSRSSENILAKNIISKTLLYIEGIYFMVTSKDNKKLGPKYNPDPDVLVNTPNAVKSTRTVIFMRHGESEWNDIFNKGFGLSMIVRLVKAMIRETLLMVTMDSVFLDSALNDDGFAQAKDLSKYLECRPAACDPTDSEELKHLHSVINGSADSSVIVASNLRRAIATTTVALWPRLQRTREKIHILSNLQEISRNIDTKALASRGTIPDLHRIADHLNDPTDFKVEEVYDVTENLGNKTSYFNGGKRLKAFNDWAFKRDESTIIVGGHSLWFKYYFQTYLPHSSDHPAKSKKMANSGLVSFTLERWVDESGNLLGYRADPTSIRTVYLGFMAKNL